FGERAPQTPPVPELFTLLETGDVPAIEAALAAGADVHARNAAGLTPLMAAVTSNAPGALIDTLLANGADIDQQAASGVTALMLAAGQGTPAQVIHLLNAGADPTVLDAEGKSALDHGRTNSAVQIGRAHV